MIKAMAECLDLMIRLIAQGYMRCEDNSSILVVFRAELDWMRLTILRF